MKVNNVKLLIKKPLLEAFSMQKNKFFSISVIIRIYEWRYIYEKTIQSKQAVNETNYLNSIPGMTDSIIKGIAESLDDCIPEEDIKWEDK